MPPHELNTNNRRAPSTSDQIAGLLESTSPGSVIRDAGISRALGTRDDCAVSVVTAISTKAAGTKVPAPRTMSPGPNELLLKMLDQRLERFIGGHVGLQRRDRHIAGLHRLMIRSAAVGMVFVERFLDPVIRVAARIGARVDLGDVIALGLRGDAQPLRHARR